MNKKCIHYSLATLCVSPMLSLEELEVSKKAKKDESSLKIHCSVSGCFQRGYRELMVRSCEHSFCSMHAITHVCSKSTEMSVAAISKVRDRAEWHSEPSGDSAF